MKSRMLKYFVVAMVVTVVVTDAYGQRRNTGTRNPRSRNTGRTTNSGYNTTGSSGYFNQTDTTRRNTQSNQGSGYSSSGSGYFSSGGSNPSSSGTSRPDTLPIRVATNKGGGGIGDSVLPSLRADGAIDNSTLVRDRTPLEYEHIRIDDAVYKHRVWRIIDTREKMNLPFRYAANEDNGNQRFISVLVNAVKNGATAFAPDDDRFTTPLTAEDFMKKLAGGMDTSDVYDLQGNVIAREVRPRVLSPDSITKFKIKEEWIFDKESSRMFVRILGIAPMMKVRTSSGITIGEDEYPVFWVYYPDLRPVLAKYEVYNGRNFGGRMTWEELFESRFFSSYIVKSTMDNPFDKDLADYIKDPLFRLLEGENIKEKIFNYEQNLWSY